MFHAFSWLDDFFKIIYVVEIFSNFSLKLLWVPAYVLQAVRWLMIPSANMMEILALLESMILCTSVKEVTQALVSQLINVHLVICLVQEKQYNYHMIYLNYCDIYFVK